MNEGCQSGAAAPCPLVGGESVRGREKGVLALTAIFAIAFAVGLNILYRFKVPLGTEYLESHVIAFNLESSKAQVALYLTLIGSFASVCAALLIWPGRNWLRAIGRADLGLVVATIIAAVALGPWEVRTRNVFFAVGVLLILAWALWSWRGRAGGTWKPWNLAALGHIGDVLYWLLIGAVLVYFAFFLLRPLSSPLPVKDALEYVYVESHYAATVVPGVDLMRTVHSGLIDRLNYGLAMPLLTGLSLKALSIIGVSNPTLVEAVKVLQVVAAGLICAICLLVNRRASPYVMAMALGMGAFMLNGATSVVAYPNQAGVRYISFLVAVLVLSREIRRDRPRAGWLASVSAILVLMSPETGLAATAGYLVAAVLMRYTPAKPIASIAGTLASYAAVFVLVGAIGALGVIGPLLTGSPGEILQFLGLFGGGYGGEVDKPRVMATLLFFLAAVAVLRGVIRARERTLGWMNVHEAAIGTMILIWLVYYVNRMHPWSLWFNFVLLALLIAPRLTGAGFRELSSDSPRAVLIQVILVCSVVAAQIAYTSRQLDDESTRIVYRKCEDGVMYAGMCLGNDYGREFTARLKVLADKYSPDKTLVLSASPAQIRLLGFNKGFPWYEPFAEIAREKDADALVNWIDKRGPPFIVMDDPASGIAQAAPERNGHIGGMVARLNGYREVERDGEWVVLERVGKLRGGAR